MSNQTKVQAIVAHVQRFTFAEILATVAFVTLLISIVVLYEARTAVIQRYMIADDNVPIIATELVLSAGSRHRVATFAQQHPELAIVAVSSVDLSTNQKKSLLTIINDPEIRSLIDMQGAQFPISSALFTSDQTSNAEISALLDGQFTCSYKETSQFIQQFHLQEHLKLVCRVPVPPYYGKLTGFLVIYSKREMSIYEIDQLRGAAIRLAIDIYRADILRTGRMTRS